MITELRIFRPSYSVASGIDDPQGIYARLFAVQDLLFAVQDLEQALGLSLTT